MWDIRFKEIRPIRSFDANKNSEYFERIKIHGSEFQISAFKCDDVKVACGKTNGDILLWDIRNESNPIWTKSTAIDCGLESSRGKAINYPRLVSEQSFRLGISNKKRPRLVLKFIAKTSPSEMCPALKLTKYVILNMMGYIINPRNISPHMISPISYRLYHKGFIGRAYQK